MADLYVAAAGSSTAPYDTWAKAATSYVTAAAAAAAGETIYVDSALTDTAAGQTISYTNGTHASPIRVFSVTHSGATGFDAIVAGANVKSSSTVMLSSGSAYVNGMTFEQSSNSSTDFRIGNANSSTQVYENCSFICSGTHASTRLSVGFASSGTTFPWVTLKNCQFKFGHSGQHININGHCDIYGGSIITGSANTTTYFYIGSDSRGGRLNVSGFDFSNGYSAADIIGAGGTTQSARFRNCKMHASWTGDLYSSVPTLGGTRWELLNYGTGDTNYKFWTVDVFGQCRDDNTVYRTTGGQDEATQYSIKMTTAATSSWPGHVLRSPPIIRRVVAGAATIAKVHIAHDGASALTDKEVWLELEYLGNSGFPLAAYSNDMQAIATGAAGTAGAAQTSSSEAWTGDSGTGPNGSSTWNQLHMHHATSLTFAETGYVIATVCLAKPSTAIYVDPKIEVS